MIIFWTLAATMLLVAIAVIVRPLLSQNLPSILGREQKNVDIARERLKVLKEELDANTIDQEQYEQSRLEIEKILANDLGSNDGGPRLNIEENPRFAIQTAVVLGCSIPLVTLLMYGVLGNNTDGLNPAPMQHPPAAGRSTNGQTLPSVSAMVDRLAQRLKENPEDPNGWRLLARSYVVMRRYPDAIDALRKARGLVGDDPDVLVELADTIASAQNGSFEGQPNALLSAVFEKTPEHPGGLWLAGRSALQQQNLPQALEYWRKLEAVLPKDAEGLESVRVAIAKVEEAMGQQAMLPGRTDSAVPSKTTEVSRTENKGAGSSVAEITVKVDLDASLLPSVEPKDTVFIYAQALTGPPMPLAVSRKTVADLPVQVRLDDSMAMMPAMSLSKFSKVRVIARVSKTGNAIPQPGDFKGQVEPVAVDKNASVEIIIAEKIL